MKKGKEKYRTLLCVLVKNGFLLFMSFYISFGSLSEYFDCLDQTEIELSEESDSDPEENDKKDEGEKDEFINESIIFSFFMKNNFKSSKRIYFKWANDYGDIPTPPPKSDLLKVS